MQNPIPKLRQTSIISKKPGFFVWKIENFDTFAEILHTFSTCNVCKMVCGVFFILFRSWGINKSVKNKCVETKSFSIFANNLRSKWNKKNPTPHFKGVGK